MTSTERSTILGTNWRIASARSSMLQDYNPDAARTHQIHTKKGGEKEQCCSLLRSKLKVNPSRTTPALWVVVYFCRPGRFRFLRFWELSVLYKETLDDLCWLSQTLAACLHCRILIGTYVLALRLCACRLRCNVLCLPYCNTQ